MAMVADTLQIGLVICAAHSLVDDVIDLGRWRHNAKSKTRLAEVVISYQDPLTSFAPRPVIAAIISADLGNLLPTVEQMNMGRTVAMALDRQLVTGPLTAHLGDTWWHTHLPKHI